MKNESGCIQYVWFLSTKNESDSESFSADIQSTKYFKRSESNEFSVYMGIREEL